MAADSKDKRQECMQTCEAEFVHTSARKPSGGVEALRVCRDKCNTAAPKNAGAAPKRL